LCHSRHFFIFLFNYIIYLNYLLFNFLVINYAHTQSLLKAAQAKLRLAYYQVEKVKEAQDSAKQVLEALKAGKLPNENISIKQRRIEETVKKVEEELNLADFILKQGTEIVEEIEQEREAQISKSEIRLSLARNKSQRMPEGRLKNRS
jgi:hypothetical protein